VSTTALVQPDGTPFLFDATRVLTNKIWVDQFDRPDGLLLGGWTEGSIYDGQGFEPIGILGDKVVATRPFIRTGTYVDPQSGGPGDLFAGIGCAWRDFSTAHVKVTVRWAGNLETGAHSEGAPIVCVVPGTGLHSWGCWPTKLAGTPLTFVGPIGNPVEDFAVYYTGDGVGLDDGEEHDISIVTDATGENCTVWVDDVQKALSGVGAIPSVGLNPAPIPAALAGSTMHGFAVDNHLCLTAPVMTTTPALTKVTIELV
jgi:hypothetical protein